MDHGLHQFCCHYCCRHCYHQTPISVCVFRSVVRLVWSLEHYQHGPDNYQSVFVLFLALPSTKARIMCLDSL
jgi:hypothetical protein